MSITVIRSGLLATIQDLGRYGYQRYGVVPNGAMDTGAARVANFLVGNAGDEAVLEVTLAGARLLIEQDMLLAICGAEMKVTVSGERLPLWRPALVNAGTTIHFEACQSGCRSYLAVAGGLNVPKIMGSRSTYLRAAIGGFMGREVKAGDKLSAGPASPLSMRMLQNLVKKRISSVTVPSWHASHFAVADELAEPMIRAMPGTDYERFQASSQAALFSETFRIAPQSDRMGYRLNGTEKLMLEAPIEAISEAVANGTVQVPSDGNPIVLLADRQTTGGYPRIAQVATVDLPVFAHLKPGDRFRFEAITQLQAERLYLDSERDMAILKAAIALKFN
jgi:antagonist of KipI